MIFLMNFILSQLLSQPTNHWSYNDLLAWMNVGCDEIIGNNVVSLTINDCIDLPFIPDEICKLSNLAYLSVCNNNLSYLPQCINNMSNLKVLLLDNNKLSSLLNNIENLPNLKILSCRNNELTTIPNFDKMPKIAMCDFEGNNVKFTKHFRL